MKLRHRAEAGEAKSVLAHFAVLASFLSASQKCVNQIQLLQLEPRVVIMFSSAEVTGLFTITASIGTLAVKQYAEGTRNANEFKRHRSDQEYHHRERLQDIRLSVYQDFITTFSKHRRTYRDLVQAWNAREAWASKIGDPEPLGRAKVTEMFDQANLRWMEIIPHASDASEALEDALAKIELVATGMVLERAKDLSKQSEVTWASVRDFSGIYTLEADIEKWARLRVAEDRLEAGRLRLSEAIRLELGVDTDNKSSAV